MIPAKTWYKTHDNKIFAIIKIFKDCNIYLKNDKHKVFIFFNYKITKDL